jgi:tellurite resistance protein TehA-like permease
MNYTSLSLMGLGLLGVMLHNLVKINEINKDPSKGTFNLASYWAKEWAAIMISVIVVFAADMAKSEIKQLEQVGNYLGLGFIALGYMAQSVLISFMGKASNIIGNKQD